MSKPLSIRLDDQLDAYVRTKPNISQYINGLVDQELNQKNVKAIASQVAIQLLQSETFFREISERVNGLSSNGRITGFEPVHLGSNPSEPAKPIVATTDDFSELPCCAANKPCKHWIFDGVKQAYVNSISGREKEV